MEAWNGDGTPSTTPILPRQPSSSSPPPPHSPDRPQPTSGASGAALEARDDAWSCVVILLTFWFFASMTLILGFYGSVDLLLGPNCSRLLQANSFFVQDIKVKADAESENGPLLHGFRQPPPLDVSATWSETHNVSVPANFHKEWIYYLNKGGQVDISYSVKSEGSYPLTLVIAQGKENLLQWIEDPSYPNTTLSWTLIHGNGMIEQIIEKPADYYVAVGNLNHVEIEVQLNFTIRTLLYNTTGAYYKCSLNHKLCVLELFLLRANVAILTTPGPKSAQETDEWFVKLSYGPRWITYFVGSGVMTAVILLAFNIFTNLQFSSGDGASHQNADGSTARSPLLPNKDDDNLSLGSSYDSVSHDDEDLEEWLGTTPLLPEGEANNTRHLCTICCDAQRDCFFLPCGHCTTCFTCGTRILDEAGTCPVCRRKTKKVRKIFNV
ncbi:E3 ubiquitin-protein ligase APD2-like isoform X2 [Phoenix dactylifera]|uniref:E3 ubiquitin-protein ligase APD2-like isoform X2 n=1 Tax=Phoenix dactylifera TaxID=42345 RepID=A0A8B7C434_PHODC|nr:E3 ubiquitin-protein ligase APD2-like isoform X2 [Phoenix dactylifera]